MERCNGPSCLFWVGLYMAEPVRWEYGEERGGSTPPPAASHARVAPQTRPTNALEERLYEPMSQTDVESERRWAKAHFHD